MPLRLHPAQGNPIEIDADRTLIGRDKTAEIRLTETSVSRKHATIERRGPQWIITDGGSASQLQGRGRGRARPHPDPPAQRPRSQDAARDSRLSSHRGARLPDAVDVSGPGGGAPRRPPGDAPGGRAQAIP
ncbi:MAG: hypothetical protein DMF77_16960, partial [Acidobacteria bacterium]